ncbi:metallophosphoesterase [Bradyrhizobium yuanmingense]|uniref:metallophosphoesterase n=1 Tax=Bradyrhizobium yuanmingense TaxID=108015 RepID=UPI0023B8B43F|nr:metallophosphoesterase [Bradyrhizobium yuanmingense]MDF0521732.1 metallophosphoesterase [Bradyrhizobium yuanmingense]
MNLAFMNGRRFFSAVRAITKMHRWLAIISDLHISDGMLDDFDDELETQLIEFLDWFGNLHGPAELVLNGDFLDFVQASPWEGSALEDEAIDGTPLCFTQAQSLEKLANIERAHPRTLDALKQFLASQSHRLTILPGNHDPDFFWPAVRSRIIGRLGLHADSNRIHFCLDRGYRPAGLEWLLIEHGHRYDKVNSFRVNGHERWSIDEPPILAARNGDHRLVECVGTRFLIRFLNGLDARYPYVDNVKPFSRFLRIFGASALTPGWAPLDAAIAVTKMLGYVTHTAFTRSDDLLGIDPPANVGPSNPLVRWIRSATDPERNELARRLQDSGFALDTSLDFLADDPAAIAPLLDHLAREPALVANLGEHDQALLGTEPGTLSLKEAYSINETEDLYDGAANAAIGGINTAVMGHTHEPFQRAQHGLTYFNTGSWTRYYRFAKEEPSRPWRILQQRSYETFPYSLRYVLVKPGEMTATMELWRERARE